MFSNFLFNNIVLQEAINICTNLLNKKVGVIEGINKSEFENLLSLATKQLYLRFNDMFYKQKNSAGLRLPLGLTLANAFLLAYAFKWPEQFPSKLRPVFYQFFHLNKKKIVNCHF